MNKIWRNKMVVAVDFHHHNTNTNSSSSRGMKSKQDYNELKLHILYIFNKRIIYGNKQHYQPINNNVSLTNKTIQ
eukprot:scaffold297_cov164-Ochromonas_danica.AAC.10